MIDTNTRSSTTSSRDPEKAQSSRNLSLKMRLKRTITVAGIVGVGLWMIIGTFGAVRDRSRQQAARSRQKLVGFSEARLKELPFDLTSIRTYQLADILSHPLFNHPSPSCRLNSYQQDRYAPLTPSYSSKTRKFGTPHDQKRNQLNYYIAINLYDSADVLPTLVRALYRLLTSLDPKRFHVSIYENGSNDSTPAQLVLFTEILRRLGTGYCITSDPEHKAGWTQGSRIDGLANLRNLALQHLYDSPPGTFDRVIFLNDVHLCEADLFELLLQHEVQEADMSCGMDFKYLKIKEFEEQGYPLLFYDVWVARDMQGLPFYDIGFPSGDWKLPSPVMPNSASRQRYESLQPVQVFSCFNGVTVLDAELFLPPHSLRFRSNDNTDAHSECYLICSDIWKALSPIGIDGSTRKGARGARIQVVPRASVGYSLDEYNGARNDKNTTAFEHEDGASLREELIKWEQFPPRLVQTYPYARWENQISIPPF